MNKCAKQVVKWHKRDEICKTLGRKLEIAVVTSVEDARGYFAKLTLPIADDSLKKCLISLMVSECLTFKNGFAFYSGFKIDSNKKISLHLAWHYFLFRIINARAKTAEASH